MPFAWKAFNNRELCHAPLFTQIAIADRSTIHLQCLDHLDIALGADLELLRPRVFVFVQLHGNDAVMRMMMRPGGHGLALRTRPVTLGGLVSHLVHLQATLCRCST